MKFEKWWTKWWGENAIAADNVEEVCKANAKAAWDAGYTQATHDILENVDRMNKRIRGKE